jgi:hypothetical protein
LVTERNWSSLQEAEAQRGEPGADQHMITSMGKVISELGQLEPVEAVPVSWFRAMVLA